MFFEQKQEVLASFGLSCFFYKLRKVSRTKDAQKTFSIELSAMQLSAMQFCPFIDSVALLDHTSGVNSENLETAPVYF